MTLPIEYTRHDVESEFGGGFTVTAKIDISYMHQETMEMIAAGKVTPDVLEDYIKRRLASMMRRHLYGDLVKPFDVLTENALQNAFGDRTKVERARKTVLQIIYGDI